MTEPVEYAELDDGAYSTLQNRLIRDKGARIQREFLEAAKNSDDFLAFMERENLITTTGKDVGLFDGVRLTEQSFKDMTDDQERAAYEKWKDVPPRVACRPSFWAHVTLRHLEIGSIEAPYWLAANGGKSESGEERIDRALADIGEKANKLVDDCVRTVLRRMSGLRAARGNRSVFVNPSFGRAWWRERMVARILKRKNVEPRTALSDVVRFRQGYWEGIVTMIVSRGSVFGSVDVQDAFVNSMAKHFISEPSTPLKNVEKLKDAMRRFSNIAASRELGALDFSEVGKIADRLLVAIHQQLTR